MSAEEAAAASESDPVAPLPVSKPDIPGMESSGRSKPKPKKEKRVKPVVVELPKLDDTEFVPPPSVLKRYAKLLNLELEDMSVLAFRLAQMFFGSPPWQYCDLLRSMAKIDELS